MKRPKHICTDTDSSDHDVSRKQPKTRHVTLALNSPTSLPFLRTTAIAHFFRSPPPHLFLSDEGPLLMEQSLRNLICTEQRSFANYANCEFVARYNKQTGRSPVEGAEFEILSVTSAQFEENVQKLNRLGLQAILRPWGLLSRVYDDEWAGEGKLKVLYDSKNYQSHGMYANTLLATIANKVDVFAKEVAGKEVELLAKDIVNQEDSTDQVVVFSKENIVNQVVMYAKDESPTSPTQSTTSSDRDHMETAHGFDADLEDERHFSDLGFIFPMPTDSIIDEIKDFQIPYDIHVHFEESLGGMDWLDSRGNSAVPNIYEERPMRKLNNPIMCSCTKLEDGVGCGDSCLNRCSDQCAMGSKCSNKRLQTLRDNPDIRVTPYSGRGFGLSAVKVIGAGSLVVEYRGEIISSDECVKRMTTVYKANRNHYFLDYGHGEVIDGHVKGTIARYINHSCSPNCHIEKWQIDGEYQVGVFASRMIAEDEELTYDYNFESFGTRQVCRCGSSLCKGYIGTSKLDGPKGRKPGLAGTSKFKEKATKKSAKNLQDNTSEARHMVAAKKMAEATGNSKNPIFLVRNVQNPKNGHSFIAKNLDQVLRENGVWRVRERALFLVRNLGSIRTKRRSAFDKEGNLLNNVQPIQNILFSVEEGLSVEDK